jgi:hypothetical protein
LEFGIFNNWNLIFMKKDFYEVLGISKNASPEEIK